MSPLEAHQAALRACARCPAMIGPVVVGRPVASRVYLLGQAPGPKEGGLGRPFAWTAGRQLFKWFATIGLDEARFRERVYMAAVCRCFPGKARSGGGDRVPDRDEIAACRPWIDAELALLAPTLVIPVGRLAIDQLLPPAPLVDTIGRSYRRDGRDVIPLPHPSGASTWFRTEPGRTRTEEALARIAEHPAWRAIQD
ncbi:MAG: uracil-DNA glycosylase family protein [Myxococcota bacterium]